MSQPRRELSLFDSTSLIVGIIIGVGFYVNAPAVARAVQQLPWPLGSLSGAWAVPLIWIAGGVLSLCGAMAYAELASMFPQHEGGDYVYLSRAYAPWAGFLFGWVQLAVVRPGDIAVMAFGFGTYAAALYDPFPGASAVIYAALAVVVLTIIHIAGVRQGKWTQNILTVAKSLGLLAIAAVAIFAPPPAAASAAIKPFSLTVALIFVLFAYGGWNEIAYVAAEIRNPARNIARTLVVGMLAVIAIYVLVNLAFLRALGFTGLAGSKAVAADAVSAVFSTSAGRIVSALVCISALGAVSGLVFTGARISYALGADYRAFDWLGKWDQRTQTPARALALQGLIALILILSLRGFVEAIFYTAACVYTFYLATAAAVIVLRFRRPDLPRPYRATLYPATILLFCLVCAFLIYGAIDFSPWISAGAGSVVLLGVPVYLLTRRKSAPAAGADRIVLLAVPVYVATREKDVPVDPAEPPAPPAAS